MFGRLAGCWAYWGYTHGYFDESGAQTFKDELQAMLALQVAAPNSPQWFNTGLHWAYGISGPAQGHFYCEPGTGDLKRSTSAYERPAPHACFIQSVDDDLVNEGGIMDLWVREARVFKYGSGTGSNFSRIRGSDERLSGGGRSSGLMSFLKIGDRAAGAIKSGGTTRRAAKMVTLDLDHPDIEQYVRWKVVEETKVAALVAGSRMLNRHLNAVLAATGEGEGEGRFSARENPALAQAVRGARAAGVPDASIQRTIDLAKQGVKELRIDEYDTDWRRSRMTVTGRSTTARNSSGRRSPGAIPSRRACCARVICGIRSARPHGSVPTRASSSTTRPMSGIPVRPTARSSPRTRARSTCSSTTRPATWPRST